MSILAYKRRVEGLKSIQEDAKELLETAKAPASEVHPILQVKELYNINNTNLRGIMKDTNQLVNQAEEPESSLNLANFTRSNARD
ncbi:MAG: hypothetical protein MRQ09_05435 [Candidatus Midichloria sp.]|nr:hypothetical protein [Candidatus Midichloria sp.]